VSLAPEGGAHQSITTPSIGLEQPGCVAFEPAFAVEVTWCLLDGLSRLGRPDGSSTYLRLSTAPVDQALAAVPADPAARDRRRRGVVGGGYLLHRATGRPRVTIAAVGATVPAALAAGVVLLTSMPTARATASEPLPAAPTPYVIAIDPGHGGSLTSDPNQLWDPGVVMGSVMEKDITLDLANRLKTLLQQERVHVVLTRTGDQYVEISERWNRVHASGARLFVSLHVNAFDGDSTINGETIFYPKPDSLTFAQAIDAGLAQSLRPYQIADETFLITWGLDAPPVGHFPMHSVLIRGKEPVLVDTGAPACREQWLATVATLVDPADVRWVFLSHDDRDHAGNLLPVLAACPNATLLTNWFSLGRMAEEWETPLPRCRFVNDGDQVDVAGEERRDARAVRNEPGAVLAGGRARVEHVAPAHVAQRRAHAGALVRGVIDVRRRGAGAARPGRRRTTCS